MLTQEAPPSRSLRLTWRHRDVVLLLTLLAVHGALLAGAAWAALADPYPLYTPVPYIRIGGGSLAVFTVLAALTRRTFRLAAVGLVGLVAAAMLTPGVVLTLALWLLGAMVLGRSVLRGLGMVPDDEGMGVVAVLLGLLVWIAIIGATAAVRLHYAPVYGLALVLPLLTGWRDAVHVVALLARRWRTAADADGLERAWMALLATLVVLHLFVVAKPEAGYDANTVHLQVPLLLAEAHRFGFDVTRRAWAVMPLGADWAFGAAYLLAGEAGARLANLAFGGLAATLLYALVRRAAPPTAALATVTLLASTPLAFLETGSLFVENLWLAYLLATLAIAVRHARAPSAPVVALLLLLAAGALQCKAIALAWLLPLAVGLAVAWRRWPRDWSPRAMALAALALVVGAWPYLNAWARTGNPVFPYLNHVFGSPWFDASTNFANDLYQAPLTAGSLYDVIVHSGRYVEGLDGAAGLHWLLLLPLLIVALVRWRRPLPWALVGLGTVFFVIVFTQQSYLRYLVPAFALLAVLGGWAVGALPQRRSVGAAVLVIGLALGILQVRLIYTGSWNHAELCPRCAYDRTAREGYLARYMPDRLMADVLNRVLPPDARVGFLMPNAPSPAGYVGDARVTNWHDPGTFDAILRATDADALAAVIGRLGITHVVCREEPGPDATSAIVVYCATRMRPLWRAHGLMVASVRPTGG
ncbi:MAG: hypothetical protein ABI920_12690 [Casimicrobiaceae bacterium]